MNNPENVEFEDEEETNEISELGFMNDEELVQRRNILSEDKDLIGDPAYCITHCDGPCCKHYAVVVSPYDIRRIMDSIPPLDINSYVTFHHGLGDDDANPFILIKGEKYYLGLQKSPETHACVFQTGVGICGIHTFSPMVCQNYPWALDSNMELSYLPKLLCNHRYPTDDPEATKAKIMASWDELDATKKMVADWNDQYGNDDEYGAKEFLQFVNCWRDSDRPIHFTIYD
jgi:Fe-S-cluster containining protein